MNIPSGRADDDAAFRGAIGGAARGADGRIGDAVAAEPDIDRPRAQGDLRARTPAGSRR